jgi:NitT/TauT family transport system substrate-binding protein/putative hydroxymethylpyrimidine transport system substrate-binding protein
VRIFKVDRYGAPPYPELVLAASRRTIESEPDLVAAVTAATARGYRFATARPERALDDLLDAAPELDRAEQAAQLRVLRPDLAPAPFDPGVLRAWAAWDLDHGILGRPLDIGRAFSLDFSRQSRG